MINIQNNVSIKEMTTIKIGGIVKYFIDVSSIMDIKEALDFIKKKNLRYFILGNGSNVLINDEYYDGCVIRINKNFSEIEFSKNEVEVSSGYLLSTFINKCREKEFSCLEKLYGIPGTIGGCIHNNAGVKDFSISDNLISIKVLYDDEIKVLSKDECLFEYRNSLFKKEKKYIILSATFNIKRIDKSLIDTTIIKAIKERLNNQPVNKYSFGCTFKNMDNISSWKYIKSLKLPIDETSKAYVSDKHASFIINSGNATFKEVYNLIETIKNSVYYIYNIKLQEEVEIIDWR